MNIFKLQLNNSGGKSEFISNLKQSLDLKTKETKNVKE